MRSGETPLLARYVRTASARACDRRVFVADDPVLSVWPEISILMSGLAMSDAATMSRIVYESGFSAERPVSNVTPRSTTGVFASVNRIGHPAASTRVPAAVPGHLSLVSSMPSPSVSDARWQPAVSTSVPAGVLGHLSRPSGTPSLSLSTGQPVVSTVGPGGGLGH